MTRAPERTCVGCRQRGSRSALLRVVADRRTVPVTVLPDQAACAPGRGAWLHPLTECLEQAVRKGAFPRALRVQGPVELGALRQVIAQVQVAGQNDSQAGTARTARTSR